SPLMGHTSAALLFFLLLTHGCSGPGSSTPVQLKYKATGKSPEVLALYEAWFGHPKHIAIDYSSHDPAVIRRQIHAAKAMGISAFVVDWYGDREPFIDQSYALMQAGAAKRKFHVAMMYDETDQEDGATDEAIADFTMFHETYLSSKAPGHQAYLTYKGRPVIFIFPKGGHTDWDRVRAVVNKWDTPPLLIDENLPGQYADALDGFYAWINPGAKGWAADGGNWGEQYLSDFYRTMVSKYPDKMIVGGAWSQFDDSKATWSLNRHISARCGQTFQDTFNFWRKYVPADDPIPFVMIETWNDYEEGSAVEHGIPTCGNASQQHPLQSQEANSPPSPGKP
ncbi:MAG: glycoside hydrolase family 71/99 protein, partial [Acidobacteriaceae bacterium]